jgi:hypothetical protein
MEKTASDCRSFKIALTISTQLHNSLRLIYDIVKTVLKRLNPVCQWQDPTRSPRQTLISVVGLIVLPNASRNSVIEVVVVRREVSKLDERNGTPEAAARSTTEAAQQHRSGLHGGAPAGRRQAHPYRKLLDPR